jgi:uncharacterized protein (TIGR02597 family)
MKTLSLNIIGLGGLFSLLVSSAFAVSSTPVGYITYTANANSDLKLGLVLEQATTFSGAVSSVTTGAIDAGSDVGDLTTNAHYVKMTSGALDGQWFQVSSASGTTVTVSEDLAAGGVVANDTFQVIPFWTLDSLFPSGGNVPGSADIFNADALVQTFDPSNIGTNFATSSGHLYYTGSLAPAGWYDSSALTPSGSTALNPDIYIQVRNSTSSAANIVITGTVPESAVTVNVLSTSTGKQDNLVYNPYPTDITLATSNLSTSGAVAGSPDIFNPTDVVLVYAPSGSAQNEATIAAYLYYTGSLAPTGWYDSSTLTPADDSVIKAGQAVIIRKASGSDQVTTWNSNLPYTL